MTSPASNADGQAHDGGVVDARVSGAPATWEYAALSMEELLRLAAKQGVPRRWDMTRTELVLTLAADRDAYDAMTLPELRDLAEKRDIAGRWDMTKSELITALLGA